MSGSVIHGCGAAVLVVYCGWRVNRHVVNASGHSVLASRRFHTCLHHRACRGVEEVSLHSWRDVPASRLTEPPSSARAPEWAKRNVKVIGLSANDLKDHQKWVEDINDFGTKNLGPTNVQFPIVSGPAGPPVSPSDQ